MSIVDSKSASRAGGEVERESIASVAMPRLADFIRLASRDIVAEWCRFAGALLPAEHIQQRPEFEDNARSLLEAVCIDMALAQSPQERHTRSLGKVRRGSKGLTDDLSRSAALHGALRHAAGHDVRGVAAEFRALRAAILRRWGDQADRDVQRALQDSMRLHEAIDQALAASIAAHAAEAERVRLLFLGVVTHDLRSPLQAVSLSGEILSHCRIDARARRAVDTIASSTRRMTRLIDQLLDFSAVSLTGRLALQLVETDLVTICHTAVDEVVEGTGRPVELATCERASGTWDEQRLEQLVVNLVGNAVEHGDRGTPVRVTLECDETAVTLSVHNGGSIPPGLLPLIFEPLLSGDPDGPRRRHCGLGLFIVQEVAVAHGGAISVHSTPQDGTTFVLRLPR